MMEVNRTVQDQKVQNNDFIYDIQPEKKTGNGVIKFELQKGRDS